MSKPCVPFRKVQGPISTIFRHKFLCFLSANVCSQRLAELPTLVMYNTVVRAQGLKYVPSRNLLGVKWRNSEVPRPLAPRLSLLVSDISVSLLCLHYTPSEPKTK